ncbi:hypothetical protein [Jiangella alkaliphila]|uniref:Uncharacterized protein n=1 Tax=Jiangella alkaliphila TaxID=419479 RepID=A0A1H2LZ50_9ACTN|nr:hypothetical protein [Jiangella alkaliphila]SDU86283.1 hypothetical protein SAMN04488563_6870 [Jiangella alkaliphila]
MNLKHLARRTITLATVAAAALVGGAAGGIALADQQADQRATTTMSGGGIVAHRVATSDQIYDTTAPNIWQTLPGSTLSYAVPSNTTRLVTAEFTAEANGRDGTGGCAVRVVTRKAGSTTLTELHPRSGVDFIWALEQDGSAAHAMSRSLTVASGTRSFIVQVQASTADTLVCRLDDWHFQIDVHTSS